MPNYETPEVRIARLVTEIETSTSQMGSQTEQIREFQQVIDQEITTDEDIIPQDQIVTLLLTKTAINIFGNYYQNALIKAIDDELQRKSFEQGTIPFSTNERVQAAFNHFLELTETGAQNPLDQEPRGKDFFDRLQFMPDQLTLDDKEYLDELFAGEQEIDDVRLMLFLGLASMRKPEDWKAPRIHIQGAKGAKNLQDIQLRYFRKISSVSKNYFNFYAGYFFAARYDPDEVPNLQLVPGDLRPVIAAARFAQFTHMLPTHFAEIINSDTFPQLTDATKALLISFYEDRFKEYEWIRELPGDFGIPPYGLTFESAANNNKGLAYFTSLVKGYMQTLPSPDSFSKDNIDWLIEKDGMNFNRLQKIVSEVVENLGADTGVKLIDIHSYVAHIINITLIGDDDRAYTVQVDKYGSVIGLQPEMVKEGVTYVNYLLGKAREKFLTSSQGKSSKLAAQPTRPIENDGITMSASTLPQLQARPLTHDERKAEYEAWAGKIELKRKRLRALGLLPPETSSDVTPQVEGRRQTESTFSLNLQPTGKYTREINAILQNHPGLQRSLDHIMRELTTNPDYIRGHLKPLTETRNDYKGMRAYSVRLGLGYRIIFITSTQRGQLIVTGAGPRKNVYDMDEEFEEALKWIDAQNQ